MNNTNQRTKPTFSFWIILAFIALAALVMYLAPKRMIDREPITTPSVTHEIPFIAKSQIDSSMEIMKYGGEGTKHNIDSMLYEGGDYYKYPVVIDKDYYHTNPPQRGDVVYFDDKVGIGWSPEGMGKPPIKWGPIIGRIVGLPGETVEIRRDIVYIDSHQLDAFYGKSSQLGGSDPLSKTPIRVPSDHVYIMFDSWFRAGVLIGPTPQSAIIGKVLGYVKP